LAEEVFSLLQELPCPDIIESQDFIGLPYYLLQRKLTERTALERVPIVVHSHGPYFITGRANQEARYRFPEYWVGQMEKFSIVAADARLSPSRFLARSVEALLQRPLNYSVIPLPAFDYVGPQSIDAHPGHIVCAGRLQLMKGTLPLIKACSQMWASGKDFKLTLIGGDTHFPHLDTTVGAFVREQYAKWIDSGHLTLLGQLDHSMVMEQVRHAWAVLVPSIRENFPNTCIEGMIAGQVVLASRSGGQAEMIDSEGANGFLFDWNVPGDFEQKLSQILALSRQERDQIGQRARERILSYCSPDNVVRQRVQHFETVIANYQPHSFFPTLNIVKRSDTVPEGTTPENEPTIDLQQANLSETTGPALERQDLLSVIIPDSKSNEHITRTLKSILNSSYSPMEILILSTNTEATSIEALDIIQNKRSANVRIVPTDNQGSAWNDGLNAADGEFVTFLDVDNLVERDFFERAVHVLQRYPNVSFVYSWVRKLEEKSIWPTWNAEFPYLLANNMVGSSAVLRRSSLLKLVKNLATDEYAPDNHQAWIELVKAGDAGVSIPFPLVQSRAQATSKDQGRSLYQQIYLYDVLTECYPEIYKEWGIDLFNLQTSNGPGESWDHPAALTLLARYGGVAGLDRARNDSYAEACRLADSWADVSAYVDQLETSLRERGISVRPNAHLIDPDTVRWRVLAYLTITRFPVTYYWNLIRKKIWQLITLEKPRVSSANRKQPTN
jgi:glycosyltransferase involved in cell wall biosynthesis